jgi:hypothetical protein
MKPPSVILLLKSLAKRLPHWLLLRLFHAYYLHGQAKLARDVAVFARLPLLETLNLGPLKTSETVFVLGSGWSINDIAEERWKIIARHDSIGFNFWPVHAFVPRIFVFESLLYEEEKVRQFRFRMLKKVMEQRAEDYANTVKIVTEVQPPSMRQLATELSEKFRKNLYVGYTAPVIARTELELTAGLDYLKKRGEFEISNGVPWLFKYGGSVIAMLSIAVRMGYKRIVLCGIDLGKQDYFYQHRERYPESADWEFAPRRDPHLTTRRLPWMIPAQRVIYEFNRRLLEPAGIALFVENRSSTLFPQLPEAPKALFKELAGGSPAV